MRVAGRRQVPLGLMERLLRPWLTSLRTAIWLTRDVRNPPRVLVRHERRYRTRGCSAWSGGNRGRCLGRFSPA